MSVASVVADTDLAVSLDPCTVTNIHGSWSGAAAVYVQVFDARSLPANGVVPSMEWKVAAGGDFDYDIEMTFEEGCFVCFSSTSGTKTLSTGGGNTGSFYVTGTNFTSSAVQTVVGDLTTGCDSDEMWADSAGPKHLIKLEVKSASAADAYAQIFPWDSPTAGQIPLLSIKIPLGTTVTCFFGKDGWSPLARSGSTVYDACQVYMSSTSATFTATSSSEFCIRGTIK